jgi:prevent-host-death family protein
MESIGAFDAKTHLSNLLERANKGEEIVITKRGEPYAMLGPVKKDHDPEEARAAIARLREYARKHPIPNVTSDEIKSWIEEGRP